ncbi:MAG: S41 family peptidase [Proteobacteria bacterium]|nr:S41 family peptidase [Pseudomonadota bacterium]
MLIMTDFKQCVGQYLLWVAVSCFLFIGCSSERRIVPGPEFRDQKNNPRNNGDRGEITGRSFGLTGGNQGVLGGEVKISQSDCDDFFQKVSAILTDHPAFNGLNELNQKWGAHMWNTWVHTLDPHGLYWQEDERRSLAEDYKATLHIGFKRRNCESLEEISASWMAKRDERTPELIKLLRKLNPTNPKHAMDQVMIKELIFLSSLNLPMSQEELTELVRDGYHHELVQHAGYTGEDLIHLSLLALTRSLDKHSSYGLGRYGFSHARNPNDKLISVAHHHPLFLVDLGANLVFGSKVPSLKEKTTTEENEPPLEAQPGDRLVALKVGFSQSDYTKFDDPSEASEILDHRKATAFHQKVYFDFERDQTITSLPLTEEHIEAQETSGIVSYVNDFEDFTKDRVVSLGVLELPNIHSHDQGVKLYLEMSNHVNKLANEEQVDALILDVRGNNEGDYYGAGKLISLFTAMKESDLIFFSKSPNQRVSMQSGSSLFQALPPLWNKPLVILVDRQTGGASEYLSHTLQRKGMAVIVGGPATEGYGAQQKYVPADNNWLGYYITTHIFFAFDGSTWNCHGLNLDVQWRPKRGNSWFYANPIEEECPQFSKTPKVSWQPVNHRSKLQGNSMERSAFGVIDDNLESWSGDPDLLEASYVALDDYFLRNNLNGGKYRFIAAENKLMKEEEQEQPDTKENTLDEQSSNTASNMPLSSSNVTSNQGQNLFSFLPKAFSFDRNDMEDQGSQAFNLAIQLKNGQYSIIVCPRSVGQAVIGATTAPMAELHECVNAFKNLDSEQFYMSHNEFFPYSYQDAKQDANEFLAQLKIHDEEQRLLYKSMGMGMIGGSISGSTSAGIGVLGGIAGVTVLDSTMDATAGVPGHVDEDIGIPKVAFITSTGTTIGTIGGLGLIIASKKLMNRALQGVASHPVGSKVAYGLMILAGVYMAFFSDTQEIVDNPWHPFTWFSNMVWHDPSEELARDWPQMVQGNSSQAMSAQETMHALKSLKDIFVKNNLAQSEELAYYCLPYMSCRKI